MVDLELEFVNSVTLGEGPGSSDVLGEVVDLLDVGQQGGVNGLLLRLPLVGQELLLLTFSEELLLLGFLAGSLGLGEVGVVDGLGNGNTGQVNLGGGGDNVGLGDSSQGDTVESERTRDEQETGIELLQEDDSLSSESTGQEDEDGTGGDGRSELGLAGSLSADLGLGDVLTGVELGLLLLLNGLLLLLGRAGLLGLEVTSLGEDSGSREPTDVGSEFRVSGHLCSFS